MGMLQSTELKNSSAEFIPAGDDFLSDYISEINQPKQAQSAPEIPDDSEFTDLEQMIPESEPSQYAHKRGQRTAKFAVGTLDKIIASMVAVYAHSDKVEDFQADDDDLDDMAEQWGVYFTESNLDLPPWVFALITTGFVMMKKFKTAGPLRIANMERAKNRKEIAGLKNQVELLTEEKKLLELRKQVEEMKPQTV
ncbi:MAG: hypothetical protein Q8R96_11640 [Bacteroidota bacterium]|nr:hypothetical protein [Bacteroidota bacterium]